MQSKYIYSFNGVVNFFRGLTLLRPMKQKFINPIEHVDKTLVWRNHVTDGYKIGQVYYDQPMDLSNFLLIRTREYLLLQNKVFAPQNVMSSGKANNFTKQLTLTSLKSCRKELDEALNTMDRLLYISKNMHDMPVAFASNALYVLERFGRGNKQYYDTVILPILKNKAEYLHAEGLAHAVWGLANAEIYDKELWATLSRQIKEKDFNYKVIKNERWSVQQYAEMVGNEHFFEKEVNPFTNKLFFQGNIYTV
jgi:hypothetical protein